jgi:small acid-soluble spore protein (thioredoxin-like protein)
MLNIEYKGVTIMEINNNPISHKDESEKTKKRINNTIQNSEIADEIIKATDNLKLKKTLEEKNARREQALDRFKNELEQK